MADNAPDASGEIPTYSADDIDEFMQTVVPRNTNSNPSHISVSTAVPSNEPDEFSETVIPADGYSSAASGIYYRHDDSIPSGQIGDFEIEHELGQGGMGTVYLAKQIGLNRQVALKTLSYEYSQDSDFVKRFLRESKAMSLLKHENVVQVYESNCCNGIYYSAMEYVDGRSLQDWVTKLKKIKVGDALHIILVCADALRHAHLQNMIHRDIKPANILITKNGIVKVADFGLAKIIDDKNDHEMTQTGMGMGTPLYMAPEQARNAKHVDHRSDIYSLGCTLYFLLTGKLPFSGDNTMELFLNKEKGVFIPAKRLNPVVPERLDLMIHKMMARDVSKRYSNYDEVIEHLQSLGLDHANLSFIRGSAFKSKTFVKKEKNKSSDSNIDYKSIPMREADSAKDAKRTEKKKGEQEQWIVWHLGDDKKFRTSKLNTNQIKTALKNGIFDTNSRATQSTKMSPVPLSQIPEFSDFIRLLKSRNAAKENSRHLAEQFAILDEADKRIKRWKWIQKIVDITEGYLGIIAFLLLGALLCLLFYEFGLPFLQELFKDVSQ